MPVNVMPGGGGSTISITGRPIEHENTIDRQGQLVRLIQVKKCPCIKNGIADLYCTLCRGEGYIRTFQRNLEIREEDSEHHGGPIIRPWIQPVVGVKKVQMWRHHINGGNIDFQVASFSSTQIMLVDNGHLPRRWEPIKVTYLVENAETVTNENCRHTGGYLLRTINTEIDTTGKTSNPKAVHGDVASVQRVFNFTQNRTYAVKSFGKQTIVIDDVGNTVPAPLITDVLQVDYKYVRPFRVLFTRIDIENAVVKYFEDLKMGDMKMTLKSRYNVGRGDIVTALTTLVKEQVVVTRGQGTVDSLPSFDIHEILENIEDETGAFYVNGTDFILSEYNKLTWLTAHKPALGKRYSVQYLYRPSYIVYRQMASPMNAEDLDFPQNVFVRFLPKVSIKDLEAATQ